MNLLKIKKFFGLRPMGRKRRRTGYYWVIWKYDPGTWCVGFYRASTDKWLLAGDSRYYTDKEFSVIDERKISGFAWGALSKVLLLASALCCLLSIFLSYLRFLRR